MSLDLYSNLTDQGSLVFYDIDTWAGQAAFLSGTYYEGLARVSDGAGDGANTSVLALGGAFPPISQPRPTGSKILQTNYGALAAFAPVSQNITNETDFIIAGLAQRRAAKPLPQPYTAVANGVSDIQLRRLYLATENHTAILVHSAVDTTPPAKPAAPVLSAVNAEGHPVITGTAETGAAVYIQANGRTIGRTIAHSADGRYAYRVPEIMDAGSYAFTVYATDSAGWNSPVSEPTGVVIPNVAIGSAVSMLSGAEPQETLWDRKDGDIAYTYEMGMRFSPLVDGTITALRYYKAKNEPGSHIGRLWNAAGTQLAQATFTAETASGWQEVALATAVPVKAKEIYTVSVNTNRYYVNTDYGLQDPFGNTSIRTLTDINGVFTTTIGTFPKDTYIDDSDVNHHPNYFRDVVFVPSGEPSDVTPPAKPAPPTLVSLQRYRATISGQTEPNATITLRDRITDHVSGQPERTVDLTQGKSITASNTGRWSVTVDLSVKSYGEDHFLSFVATDTKGNSSPRSEEREILLDSQDAIEWTTGAISVKESAGSITVPFTRSGPSLVYVTCEASLVAGTATGADYGSVSTNPIKVEANGTSGFFTIPIKEDAFTEGNESFSLTLRIAENPYDRAAMGSLTTCVITILDNEGPKAPAITVAKGTVGIALGGTDRGLLIESGSSAVTNYVVRNVGEDTLVIDVPTLGNLSNLVGSVGVSATSVAPGGSATIAVTLTPANSGSFTGRLSMVTNDTRSNPFWWTIAGETSSTYLGGGSSGGGSSGGGSSGGGSSGGGSSGGGSSGGGSSGGGGGGCGAGAGLALISLWLVVGRRRRSMQSV